jgi:hypothetical protein
MTICLSITGRIKGTRGNHTTLLKGLKNNSQSLRLWWGFVKKFSHESRSRAHGLAIQRNSLRNSEGTRGKHSILSCGLRGTGCEVGVTGYGVRMRKGRGQCLILYS